MCGRYDNLIPREAYAGLFKATRVSRSNFPPRYNVAPTDQIPIVRIDPRDGMREMGPDTLPLTVILWLWDGWHGYGPMGSHSLLDEREAKSPPHPRASRDGR
jgi:hypothetical protein